MTDIARTMQGPQIREIAHTREGPVVVVRPLHFFTLTKQVGDVALRVSKTAKRL